MYNCTLCKSSYKNLEVHHDVETRSEVVKKIATQFNWHELTKGIDLIDINNIELRDLKLQISNAVVDYHVDNKVSGKVLCKQCHRLEHKSYNFHDNDIDESSDTDV